MPGGRHVPSTSLSDRGYLSRKIVAGKFYERESADLAAVLIRQACWRGMLYANRSFCIADNGSP